MYKWTYHSESSFETYPDIAAYHGQRPRDMAKTSCYISNLDSEW